MDLESLLTTLPAVSGLAYYLPALGEETQSALVALRGYNENRLTAEQTIEPVKFIVEKLPETREALLAKYRIESEKLRLRRVAEVAAFSALGTGIFLATYLSVTPDFAFWGRVGSVAGVGSILYAARRHSIDTKKEYDKKCDMLNAVCDASPALLTLDHDVWMRAVSQSKPHLYQLFQNAAKNEDVSHVDYKVAPRAVAS